MKGAIWFAGAFSLVVSASATAQNSGPFGSSWGLRVGASYFTDNEMKSLFGSGRISFGFSPTSKGMPGDMQVATDIDIQIANQNGNRLIMIPVTVGVTKTFGDRGSSSVPYAAFRIGGAYSDYRLNRVGGVSQGKKFLPASNFEVGVIMNKKLRLSARYDLIGATDNIRFNNYQFSASFELFRF